MNIGRLELSDSEDNNRCRSHTLYSHILSSLIQRGYRLVVNRVLRIQHKRANSGRALVSITSISILFDVWIVMRRPFTVMRFEGKDCGRSELVLAEGDLVRVEHCIGGQKETQD